MSSAQRTIGVCNGGGDCPGLNAVIRAVVRTAILEFGWTVVGVKNGFNGLIWPEQSEELTLESIRGILPRGERSSAPRTAATPSILRWKKTVRW